MEIPNPTEEKAEEKPIEQTEKPAEKPPEEPGEKQPWKIGNLGPVERLMTALACVAAVALVLAIVVSLPYMHRLFQTHLGLAPGQYIAKIRMEEAKTLLRSGSLSMGAVAREMGFSSQQHFSRQFRSVCGMTPSEYEKSLKKGGA